MKSLVKLKGFFASVELLAEEEFVKNRVKCKLETTDLEITLGFVGNDKLVPMSLMFNNLLDEKKAVRFDFIACKNTGEEKYSKIINGQIDSKNLPEEIGVMLKI
ncbi:MAG: hypothetical protein LBN08_01295 [Lactobacillales bacterium]|jgi:hypothetical protein|nr:hypothetical protein [Lactobacillales bacterium]